MCWLHLCGLLSCSFQCAEGAGAGFSTEKRKISFSVADVQGVGGWGALDPPQHTEAQGLYLKLNPGASSSSSHPSVAFPDHAGTAGGAMGGHKDRRHTVCGLAPPYYFLS